MNMRHKVRKLKPMVSVTIGARFSKLTKINWGGKWR